MPYKRKTFRRRRRKPLAKMVRSIVARNLETKHKTYQTSNFDPVSTTGTLVNLTAVGQGISDAERVGDRLRILKIHLQKVFKINSAQVTAATVGVRVIIAQSRASSLVSTDFPSFEQACDLDKMIVLRDRMFTLNVTTARSADGLLYGSNLVRLNWKITKFPKTVLQYVSAGIVPNFPVYFYAICDVGEAQYAGYNSLYFKDG